MASTGRSRTLATAGLTALVLGGVGVGYMASRPQQVQLPPISVIAPQDPTLYKTPVQDQAFWSEFSRRVESSVFCIRNEGQYEFQQISPVTEQAVTQERVALSHGTGFVIGKVQTFDGTTQCRLLTNRHVPTDPDVRTFDERPFSSGIIGRLVKSDLHIVQDADDAKESDDIELRLIATNPDLDLAIVETVGPGCTLPVADIIIGVPKRIDQNDALITAGFPFAKNKQIIQGKISSTTFQDYAVLPYPREVYAADLRFDPGQSGSPVVVPLMDEGGKLQFYLAGLIYASAPQSDTTRLLTPMSDEAIAFVSAQEAVESKRPSLSATVGREEWRRLRGDSSNDVSSYDLFAHRYILRENNGRPMLRRYPMAGSMVIDNQWLDIEFGFADDGIAVEKIVANYDGKKIPVPLDEERLEYYGPVFNALLNDLLHQKEFREVVQRPDADSAGTRMRGYLASVINAEVQALSVDLNAFDYDLKKTAVLPRRFE